MSSNLDNLEKTKEWYDKNSKDYTMHVRDSADAVYHHYYEKPAMYGLLASDLTGKRILSLGCGSGEDCGELVRRGASVVGIDIAAGLIDEAKKAYQAPTTLWATWRT